MNHPREVHCRICGGAVDEFLDLGRQPLADAFRDPTTHAAQEEFFYHLVAGRCRSCTMVQLVNEVPREQMFHVGYPYHTAGSSVMRAHFTDTAHQLRELAASDDPFIVEIGCNDGTLLRTLHEGGVRHLGFEPSGGVAAIAKAQGIRVREEFFEYETALRARQAEGPADIIFAANTVCHIPYLDSVLRGVDELLAPDGRFLFEDPYLGDIVAGTAFDQFYDEHFYYFTATSVSALAARFGFELVDVERLPVHGGEVRYTLARRGRHRPSQAVAKLLEVEQGQGITELPVLRAFAETVAMVRTELLDLLRRLRADGRTVVGYGATAKSATVLNYCGIDADLVPYICDTTAAKQGRLTPGTHIPVRPAEAFAAEYPEFALLLAWNHAEEIIAREQEFRASGGQWIRYVPDVRID